MLFPAASLVRPHIWKAPLYSHGPTSRTSRHEFGSAVISNSCPYQLSPCSCCFSSWKGVWKTEEESQSFFTVWSQKMLSLAPQCEKQWWLEHAPRNMTKASLLKKRPYRGNTSISRVHIGRGRSCLQFSSWSSYFVHIIVKDWLRRSVGVNKEFSRRQKSWLPVPALTYTLTFYLQPALDKRHQQIMGPWDLACSRASCTH